MHGSVGEARKDAAAARSALTAAVAHARSEAAEAAAAAQDATARAVQLAREDAAVAMETAVRLERTQANRKQAALSEAADSATTLVAQLQEHLRQANANRAADQDEQRKLRLEVRQNYCIGGEATSSPVY